MKLNKYIEEVFPDDIKTMTFCRPNSVILNNPQSFRMDIGTTFFGGKDWSNMDKDLSAIDKDNLESFCISLFIIVVIDLTMFTHFKDEYEMFRKKTMYPKFGWCGFGPHYEDPKKLLTLPKNKHIISLNVDPLLINEYTDLFIEKCNDFFMVNIPQISSKSFIQKILNDSDMTLTNGENETFLYLFLDSLRSKLSNNKV